MNWYDTLQKVKMTSTFALTAMNADGADYHCGIDVYGDIPLEKRYELALKTFERFRGLLWPTFESKLSEAGAVYEDENGNRFRGKDIFKIQLVRLEDRVFFERTNGTYAKFGLSFRAGDAGELEFGNEILKKTLNALGFMEE